jgi:DNA repair protein RadC
LKSSNPSPVPPQSGGAFSPHRSGSCPSPRLVRGDGRRPLRFDPPLRSYRLASARPRLQSLRSVVRYMGRRAAREPLECFWCVPLDLYDRAMYRDPLLVSVGTQIEVYAEPCEILRVALVAEAAHIVTVHNHPSGDPSPSGYDRTHASRLARAARLLNVPLVDSVVIGLQGAYSFRDAGHLSGPTRQR